MSVRVLLDVAPDPVTIGVAGLVLIVVVGFFLALVAVVGVLFLLKWRRRRKVIEGTFAPVAGTQPSHPNQP